MLVSMRLEVWSMFVRLSLLLPLLWPLLQCLHLQVCVCVYVTRSAAMAYANRGAAAHASNASATAPKSAATCGGSDRSAAYVPVLYCMTVP